MPLSFLEAHYYLEALLLDRNQPSFILDFFWFLVRAYVTTTVRAGVMEIGEIGHEMADFGMKIIVDRHGDSRIRFRKSTRSRSKNPHVRSISSSRDRHCRGVCGDFLIEAYSLSQSLYWLGEIISLDLYHGLLYHEW